MEQSCKKVNSQYQVNTFFILHICRISPGNMSEGSCIYEYVVVLPYSYIKGKSFAG